MKSIIAGSTGGGEDKIEAMRSARITVAEYPFPPAKLSSRESAIAIKGAEHSSALALSIRAVGRQFGVDKRDCLIDCLMTETVGSAYGLNKFIGAFDKWCACI